MRIVVITHTTPNLPNKDGLTVILYHLLEQLQPNHTVTVFAADQFQTEAALVEAVKRKLDTADVLYFHGSMVCHLIEHFPHDHNIVAGYIDAESSKYSQLVEQEGNILRKRRYAKQQIEWEELERTQLSRAHTIIVSTEIDAQALRKTAGSQPFIEIIPNGVDSDYFAPDPIIEREHAIVFSGVLDQPTHVQAVLQFTKDVWPQITSKAGGQTIKWYIVGKQPDKRIEKLSNKDGNIIVTGFVPEVREFLLRCKVYISPLHVRSGIRNTVLEAMSCGLPVVAYADACQGLETSPIRKVNTADDFAHTINEWLANPETADQVAARGRLYIEQFHNWPQQANRYEDIFTNASQNFSSKTNGPETK